jgi:membrane-bound lytic murein transglycosylase D
LRNARSSFGVNPSVSSAAFAKYRALCFLLTSCFFSVAAAQDPANFPRPAELEPAINFWTRVYTEVDTRSGFLHDARHLNVVYGAHPT